MTSQKTIERCRVKVKELEEANATLLKINVTLAESNKNLRDKINKLEGAVEEDARVMNALRSAKEQCKQTCEHIVSEKSRIIQEKERYIAGLHNTVWNLRNSYLCSSYQFVETPEGFKLEFGFKSK